MATMAFGDVEVATEHLPPGTAKPWGFTHVPGPSCSDAGQGARFTVVANALEPRGAPAEALNNGAVSAAGNDLTESVFFTNANADDGALLMDLGAPVAIAQINTYSWHEYDRDHGARAPQVYTVYGCRSDAAPKPSDTAAWSKLAEVDTRPNTTGTNWGGQFGVSIRETSGKPLGTYRYLLFHTRPTRSPKQPNPVWTHTFFTEIDVHTAATHGKAGDARMAKHVAVEHVWVVFKTHFDLGYTDLAEDVFRKYRVNMMDGALRLIEQNRTLPPDQRFVWTVAGWPLARAILDREPDPARRERIARAVREGSLAVHALPATLHTESLDLEDLVRGLTYSVRLARENDRPLPIAGKMTDVPEHGWVLPTLLAHAGIRFLQLGCNSACQYPRFPRLFWWEGPDGSRILCNYTVNYGSSLAPPPDWPSRNYLAMIMTGDNHGPPTPQDVENVRSQLARNLPGAKVTLGTLDDFARAVLAEAPELPVVRGDTPDTWIHGLLSMPRATKLARDIRPLEPVLDALDTHLRAWGLTPPPLAHALAEAYENSLLYGEHTWGMNGAYGGRDIWPLAEWKRKLPPERQQRFLQSFDDHRNYIRTTAAIVNRELNTRLELLARTVATNGERVVVWNGLPWPRSGTVAIPEHPERVFYAENVPANGYRVYPADRPEPSNRTEQSAPSDPRHLDTRFFRVTFDLERGGLASLVEKASGRELADAASPYALGQFLHERFSQNEVDRFFKAYSRMPGGWALQDLGKPGMPAAPHAAQTLSNVHATAPGQPNPGAMAKPGMPPPREARYATVTPARWSIVVERSAEADTARLTAGDTRGLSGACSLTFTFSRHTPSVEVAWSVVDKTPDKRPEGGWLCFPFAVANPRFTVGRPGGPIDPATDIVPGAGRHLYAVATGVALTGRDGVGVGLCPIDSPLVSLGLPGLWRWSIDYVPHEPSVFVNLYNNQWNTNFPLWQDGSWTVRVLFWPVGVSVAGAARLVTPAWNARVPLLAASATGPAGTLPLTRAGLSVSRPGVLVTAFGGDPYGHAGTLLRVWDQAGAAEPCVISLPPELRAATAQPVDLRGTRQGARIAITNNTLAIGLDAFAPASFLLNP